MAVTAIYQALVVDFGVNFKTTNNGTVDISGERLEGINIFIEKYKELYGLEVGIAAPKKITILPRGRGLVGNENAMKTEAIECFKQATMLYQSVIRHLTTAKINVQAPTFLLGDVNNIQVNVVFPAPAAH